MENHELYKIRHSLAHIMASAIRHLYGKEVHFGVGPVIDDGFYYDIDPGTAKISESDLDAVKKEMQKIISQNLDFIKKEMSIAQAKTVFKNDPYKAELIENLEKHGTTEYTLLDGLEKNEEGHVGIDTVTIYTTGDFTDLCRGPHIENTKELTNVGFTLTKIAGSYWRGDEKNAQLTRLYGVAFSTKQELNEYLEYLKEAEKRDHKKLGKDLGLFTFSPLVGPGLPLFTPKGTLIRELLTEFLDTLQKKHGYTHVTIPHITKKELYETSGHWEKFKNELFKVITREGHEFALKPMNCPHHTQIYAAEKRSYRDLPQRYAEVTAVYRDEQTGELSGLSRVRAITQDDAHIFCRMQQVETEALKIWDIVDSFYKPFAMPMKVRLSRHDPRNMGAYLGSEDVWKKAEAILAELIIRKKQEYTDAPGEAAFYGPKIDFIIQDSLKREWQLATIQLDFNLPERFNLTCVNEQGEDERIVMIHRAIMGAVERFMAIMIEHFAGAFPLWLAPVQIGLVPVGHHHIEKCHLLQQYMLARSPHLRISIDSSDETVGYKIRRAAAEKIPYTIVIGDKEIPHTGSWDDSANLTIRTFGKPEPSIIILKNFLDTALQTIALKLPELG